jgi:hypothetical protein
MMMDDEGDGNVGLEDACQAFSEACEKKDWKAAAEAFADAQRLSDDDSGMAEDGEKKPGLTLVFGEKKK